MIMREKSSHTLTLSSTPCSCFESALVRAAPGEGTALATQLYSKCTQQTKVRKMNRIVNNLFACFDKLSQ